MFVVSKQLMHVSWLASPCANCSKFCFKHDEQPHFILAMQGSQHWGQRTGSVNIAGVAECRHGIIVELASGGVCAIHAN